MNEKEANNSGERSGADPPGVPADERVDPSAPSPEREGPRSGSGENAAPYPLEPEPETSPPPSTVRPGLIDDFDEDADFSHDPEVEAALSGKASAKDKAAKRDEAKRDEEKPVEVLAREGWDRPKATAIVGGVITIPAVVASWMTASAGEQSGAMDGLIATLLTLYNTGLHTLTGIAAVILGAVLLNLRPGRLDVVAARMLAAVATFQALAHLNLGYGLPVLFGVIGYLAVLALLMRTTRDRLFVISAGHLLLVGITQLGMMLYAAADARAGG